MQIVDGWGCAGEWGCRIGQVFFWLCVGRVSELVFANFVRVRSVAPAIKGKT